MVKKSSSKKTVEGEAYWSKRPADDERLDWRNQAGSWVEEYVQSAVHPHRESVVEAVRSFSEVVGILEVGCNAGPNLLRLAEAFPETQLAGFDINPHAISRACEVLPRAILKEGSLSAFPFGDKEFDIGVADAVLMYADPELCRTAFKEFQRVVRKGLVLVEWFDEDIEGVVKDYHWARNYPAMAKEYGFELVAETPLTEETWPHKTWVSNGRLFTFRVQ